MAIPKPDDPHGTTAPLAWVYTDEDILRAYSDAFAAVAKTVSIQLESAEAEPEFGHLGRFSELILV